MPSSRSSSTLDRNQSIRTTYGRFQNRFSTTTPLERVMAPTISLAKVRLNEAVNLITSTTVLAVFYTLLFVLYCLSARLCYFQLRDHNGNINRQTAFTMAFITVLLICATMDIVISNRHVQMDFIVNNTLPGGPLGFPATLRIITTLRIDGIVNLVEDFLILGVLVNQRLVFRACVNLSNVSLLSYGVFGLSGPEPASSYPSPRCLYSSISQL